MRRRGPPGAGITIRPASERDRTTTDWLDSRHTFAFGTYDRIWSGLGPLKVLNEDTIAPARGFDLHPHWDMEILTCVLSGELEHEDTLGHRALVRAGEIQLISAGTGIEHAERNPSHTAPVHLFQIWITPLHKGLPPRHQHATVPEAEGLTLLAAPASSPLLIQQNVEIYRGILPAGRTLTLQAGHTFWLQLARGELAIGAHPLVEGDGAAIIGQDAVQIVAGADAWFLLFDLG